MSTEITTDYRTIVNFLLVVMKYSKFVQSFTVDDYNVNYVSYNNKKLIIIIDPETSTINLFLCD